MRIISIDVGIKNLAYCIIEYDGLTNTTNINTTNINTTKILHWDVINLCGEEHLCTCPLQVKVKVKKEKGEKKKVKGKKKGEQGETTIAEEPPLSLCQKKASYFKGEQYYCQTHAKKSTEYLLPNSSLKNIKKWKREALVAYALSQELVFPDACKKDELLKQVIHYIGEKTLEKIRTVSANEMTLVQMGIQLVKDFDKVLCDKVLCLNEISLLDKIIIENQISPIANRMKTLQGMIAQYFIMRGNPKIAFISSANKLKMFTNKELDANAMEANAMDANAMEANAIDTEAEANIVIHKNKSTYSERKKAGVEIVKDLLGQHNEIWLPTFLTHKKKDDLADAFLQGLWFLNKK